MQDRKCKIRDKNGTVISSSQNLRGIREYARTHLVKSIDVAEIGEKCSEYESFGGGQLSILFEDGSSFQTRFGSFQYLKEFIKKWRSVYGSPLTINGLYRGLVSKENVHL